MRKIILTGIVILLCPVLALAGFVNNEDGTVTDTDTGLMWQRTTGYTLYTWQQALSHCESLNLSGYTDWRLPNIKELQSIVDQTVSGPAINTSYFPDTTSANYWSSTTIQHHTGDGGTHGGAWSINFGYGSNNPSGKASTCYVRAVRGGQ